MTQVFKKGQIVPRRLRMAMSGDSKSQHAITFGCDVSVTGRTVTPTSCGPVFVISTKSRKMNNGTFKRRIVSVKDVCVERSDQMLRIDLGSSWQALEELL